MGSGCSFVRHPMPQPAQKFLGLFCLAFMGFLTGMAEDAQKVTFHVQLIRGADSDKPDDPSWKAIGPKLNKNLRTVFRWTNYWEVKRESATLAKGKVAKLRLTPERTVEIRLLDPPNTQIRLFHNGGVTRRAPPPLRPHNNNPRGGFQNGGPPMVDGPRGEAPDAG